MVLAIVGSTLMVYGDEKRGEATAEEVDETTSEEREQASKPAL